MSKFFSQIQTTRVCKECRELIVLEEFNFVYNKKRYIHYDCFVGKLTNKKIKPLEVEEAKSIANELKNDEDMRKVAEGLIAKNRLYSWLKRAYEIVTIPSYFFQKMEDVYNGNFKDIEEKISPEDILFIWRKKKLEFDKLNDYQKKRGKIIEGSDRLNYDLAIVLNKYGSYKIWKEQQKALKIETQESMTKPRFNFDDLNKKVMDNLTREDDISIYLDEI